MLKLQFDRYITFEELLLLRGLLLSERYDNIGYPRLSEQTDRCFFQPPRYLSRYAYNYPCILSEQRISSLSDLQCTVTVAEAFALDLTPFQAVHTYSPACPLLMLLIVKRSP